LAAAEDSVTLDLEKPVEDVSFLLARLRHKFTGKPSLHHDFQRKEHLNQSFFFVAAPSCRGTSRIP